MQIKSTVARNALLVLWVALAIACRGKGTIQIAEFSKQIRTLPGAITVVNWNSRKGEHPQFARDLHRILTQEKPDIVFLQEATADLFEPNQMGGYLAKGWSYPWPGAETTGVLTLSKVAPIRVEPVSTLYGELGRSVPKVSLVTEYPLPNGERLLAVNVHLLNFERWSVKKLGHQLEELKAIMARHSGPILMVGDFNTWNRKRLGLVKKITREIRLQEVTGFSKGRTTGDKQSRFWNDILGVDKDLPLDRVFLSGLRPRSARVLNIHSSDHRPLVVKLELDR